MNRRSGARYLRVVPPIALGIAALGLIVASTYWTPRAVDEVAAHQAGDEPRDWAEQVFAPAPPIEPDESRAESGPNPTKAQPGPTATSDEVVPAAPPASIPDLSSQSAAAAPPVAPSPTPTVAPPTATPVPACPTAGMGGFAAALFDAVNQARAANGMAALAADGCVTYVAQLRSQDMAANGYFAHTSPAGQTAFSLMDANGVPYAWAGENLARNNYPDAEAVAVAIRDLMASDGHRANILHNRYTRLGVGYAIDGEGIRYFTMVFTGS